MSIQWTLIAGFLYAEIGLVLLMISPIFCPQRWNQFFKSHSFVMLQRYATVYFFVLQGTLFLCMLDAMQDMKKYSQVTEASHTNLAAEMRGTIKLFRAQRNFYITGFTIVLGFVVRRLANMLSDIDELNSEAIKAKRDAEEAVRLARNRGSSNTMQTNDAKNMIENHKHNGALLKKEQNKVKELKTEVEKWKAKYEVAISGKGTKED